MQINKGPAQLKYLDQGQRREFVIGEVIEPKSTHKFSDMDFVCWEVLIQVDWTPLWLWVESSRS